MFTDNLVYGNLGFDAPSTPSIISIFVCPGIIILTILFPPLYPDNHELPVYWWGCGSCVGDVWVCVWIWWPLDGMGNRSPTHHTAVLAYDRQGSAAHHHHRNGLRLHQRVDGSCALRGGRRLP